jgi:hypothetical protein
MLEELLHIDVSSAPARAALYQRLQRDSALREAVRSLSRSALHQEVGGCTDCLIDAIIQLKLKGEKAIMEKKTSQYAVKAGVVINDLINFDAGKVLTAASCTEELALYHLRTNPECRKYFSRLPENIDEVLVQEVPDNNGMDATSPPPPAQQAPTPPVQRSSQNQKHSKRRKK